MSRALKSANEFWLEENARPKALQKLAKLAKADGEDKPRWVSKLRRIIETRIEVNNKDLQIEDRFAKPNIRTFYSFVTGETDFPRENLEILTALALYYFKYLPVPGKISDIYKDCFPTGSYDLAKDFGEYCVSNDIDLGKNWDWRSKSTAEKIAIHSDEARLKGSLFDFFHNMRSLLKVGDYEHGLEARLFPKRIPKNEEYRRFVVYRNSISPDFAAKMYGFFRRPSAEYPYPRFAIFYRDSNGKQLETSGIVIAASTAIYLFGPIGSGVGLNLIAINNEELNKRELGGIQLGSDSVGRVLASRLVFVETEITSSGEAEIGIVTKDKVEAELSPLGVINFMKNRVGIERFDLHYCGDLVSARQLQRIVAERLSESGASVLTTISGQPFNPADPDHLPFNTTLLPLGKFTEK